MKLLERWKAESPLRRELAEYRALDFSPEEIEEMLLNYEALMCEATGGRLSKCCYHRTTVLCAFRDYLQECAEEAYDEGYKDAMEKYKAEGGNYVQTDNSGNVSGNE